MAQVTYGFRSGTRVPPGVDADQVAAERQWIVDNYGKASVPLAVTAVLSQPDMVPGLRAFAPKDEEEAMERATATAVRYAFSSLIPVRIDANGKPSTDVAVRAFFAVADGDGDIVYDSLSVIVEEGREEALMNDLRRDARVYSSKQDRVLAEIQELIRELRSHGTAR